VRSRVDRTVVSGALWLVAVVTLQATLGILTLLNQVPIDLALSHQAVAIAVLTLAVMQAERLAARQVVAVPQEMTAPLAQAG
jgi:cytochrome c oxidase assembly protein subunit 15